LLYHPCITSMVYYYRADGWVMACKRAAILASRRRFTHLA
jgi:hypothetical protein